MALGMGAAIADKEMAFDVSVLTSFIGFEMCVVLGRVEAETEVADFVLWRAVTCP